MPAEAIFVLGFACGLFVRQIMVWRHRHQERTQRHARLTAEGARWRRGVIQ